MENKTTDGQGTILSRIQNILSHMGKTLNWLESELGFAHRSISKWGKSVPSADKLYMVAQALDTDMYSLLGVNKVSEKEILPDENFVATPHLVAYFDILGVKNLMNGNKYIEVIKNIYNCLVNPTDNYLKNNVFLEMSEDYQKQHPDIPFSEKPKVKIFTDNIVVYMPYDNDNFLFALVKVLYIIAYVQYQLFISEDTVLLRGGISIKNLIQSNKFLLGDSIVEAYTLEENVAIFPRIVLSREIENIISKSQYCKSFFDGENAPLVKDFDGKFFVNYLGSGNRRNNDNIETKIISGLNDLVNSKAEERVIQKWEWLLNYQAGFPHSSRQTYTIVVESGSNTQRISSSSIHNQQNIFNSQNCNNIYNETGQTSVDDELLNIYKTMTESEKLMLLGYAKKLKEDKN